MYYVALLSDFCYLSNHVFEGIMASDSESEKKKLQNSSVVIYIGSIHRLQAKVTSAKWLVMRAWREFPARFAGVSF